ncbi:5' nucleotidase, NT5C type [Cohnella abietis]|uniref:Nucleotidase n=1 Tax=Cohnella abietis TaxID=2507935 RepID=A0A3T1CYU5_9BACL|nr:HAD family acid phosphatase [Cohnella abietis]BBI31033.1 putative nucleotidase [Cohnella abietis]
MKFGFDIDDTLLNLREHAFRLYNSKLNKQISIDVFHALTTIPIHDAFGLTVEEGRQMWNSHREEIFYSAPPFAEAVQVLQELVSQGHEVYYVTARTVNHCERTKNGLIQLGFPVQEGSFYCGMGDTEKVHIIRDLGLDYYFDDKPAVLDTLTELDLIVYAKDNSYNRHMDIPRIMNWSELLGILKIN